MVYYFKLYLTALGVFLLIDMVWLGLVARTFYASQIGYIMTPSPNWAAAILFYLLFILGVLVFVVLPGLQEPSLGVSLGRAALFGLVTYATYDLTNLATLKDWPLLLTAVDLVWGTLLTTLVSAASLFFGRRLA
jgi:uncharacterized membrane protein